MRILLIGATGLIGSAVAARLKRENHEIVALGRGGGPAAARLPVDAWIRLDLRDAVDPAAWRPHLAGIDAVVNCAGALQDNGRDSVSAVHREAPAALWREYEAAVASGTAKTGRVIHLSAINVEQGGVTAFSRTKCQGDATLQASSLDWVILRPSVVVGRSAYGGSALFRGLAALPVALRAPEAERLDIVQLDDVAETVARLLRPGAPSRVALDLAGPDRLSFEEVIAAYRSWLGWPAARTLSLPSWAMAAGYRAGDALARLGWRPAIRTTARGEIARGAMGDGSEWRRLLGIAPQSLASALAAEPASVQERWFARLYFLKSVAIGTFALFWLLTGLISLGPGYGLAVAYMERAGAGALSGPGVIAGGLADLAVAAGIAWQPTAKRALQAAILLSVLYLVAGTLLLPELWRDPLGPMMKIWPILALNLVCLAMLDER